MRCQNSSLLHTNSAPIGIDWQLAAALTGLNESQFAIDAEGVFGGRDECAAKVAGLEMAAIQSCCQCNVDGIHFPMAALLDHKGFRLIAQSLLPLERLVYGSDDAGQTVRNDRPDLAARVRALGAKLNLKPHLVTQRSQPGLANAVEMFSAADVEGHVGRDGRFYVLDVSRTFPPVRPDRDSAGSFLFQLFRPQFVMVCL